MILVAWHDAMRCSTKLVIRSEDCARGAEAVLGIRIKNYRNVVMGVLNIDNASVSAYGHM